MHLWFSYGPSTDDDGTLRQVLMQGANGCRLTFSYGAPALQQSRADKVRRIAGELGIFCTIIADLGGEKPRLGDFESPKIEIRAGEIVALCPPGIPANTSTRLFPITVREVFRQAKTGDKIIIGDGSLSLGITSVSADRITAVALDDGAVNPNRGITLQGSSFCPRSLTDKDIRDLEFVARSESFDAIALSFVADAGDVLHARTIVQSLGRQLPIIAKIETEQGLSNLPRIAQTATMILAARGDLALIRDWTELPGAMQEIAATCTDSHTPWVLATQVVEGLERFIFPTRAEICDLAFWLKHGAAGVLLTYETVFGPRPVAAVSAVARMIGRWGQASGQATSNPAAGRSRL